MAAMRRRPRPSLRIVYRPRRPLTVITKAIRFPSGDHAGAATGPGSSFTRRSTAPPARMTHSSRIGSGGRGRPFLRGRCAARRVKAIRRPLGDHAGVRSSAAPLVSRRTRPPRPGSEWTSPSRTNASRSCDDHAGASSSPDPDVSRRSTRPSALTANRSRRPRPPVVNASSSAAGRPRRIPVGLGAEGHLPHVRAVLVHDPDLVPAREREPAAGGGERRVQRRAGGGQPPHRLAAGGAQQQRAGRAGLVGDLAVGARAGRKGQQERGGGDDGGTDGHGERHSQHARRTFGAARAPTRVQLDASMAEGRDILREWQDAMQSLASTARSAAGAPSCRSSCSRRCSASSSCSRRSSSASAGSRARSSAACSSPSTRCSTCWSRAARRSASSPRRSSRPPTRSARPRS